MAFWNKKRTIEGAEYEAIQKSITALAGDLARLSTKVECLGTDVSDLRGRLQKKLDVPRPKSADEGEKWGDYKVLNTLNPFVG